MTKIITIVLLIISPAISFGQSKGLGITPMHKFFQKCTDSTIIIEYANVGDARPSFYRVLSKTGDLVNSFKYDPVDTSYYVMSRLRASMPVALWNMFMAERVGFIRSPASINIFFNYVHLEAGQTKKLWQELTLLKPWQLIDDYSYGSGCKGIPAGVTFEGGPWIVHLITKNEIKTLYYLAPEYFEKQCPGNKNRQAAILIEKKFKETYPIFNP